MIQSKEEIKEIQAAISLKKDIVELLEQVSLERNEGQYIVQGKQMYFWKGVGFKLISSDTIDVLDVTADTYKPFPNHRYVLGLIKADIAIALDMIRAEKEQPLR